MYGAQVQLVAGVTSLKCMRAMAYSQLHFSIAVSKLRPYDGHGDRIDKPNTNPPLLTLVQSFYGLKMSFGSLRSKRLMTGEYYMFDSPISG